MSAVPLVVVCSVKGRPGVTATALGLAAVAAPGTRPVLVELDPAGGDLAARHRWPLSPGLVEFAAAARSIPPDARRGGAGAVVSGYCRALPLAGTPVDVVVGPVGGGQVRAALSVLAGPGLQALRPPDRLVVADCGRVDAASAVWPLLGAADAVLLVVGGRAEDVLHARELVGGLRAAAGDRCGVLVRADGGPYRVAEVGAALDATNGGGPRVVGELPTDGRAASVLDGLRLAGGRWRRLPLFRALAGVLPLLPIPAGPSSVAGRVAPQFVGPAVDGMRR